MVGKSAVSTAVPVHMDVLPVVPVHVPTAVGSTTTGSTLNLVLNLTCPYYVLILSSTGTVIVHYL